MPSVEIPQVSLVKGEVSPLAADRTDSNFYASALQTGVNVFIHAEGGGSNRPGTQYIGNCLSNTPNGSYLLPFVYNNQQTYICEFSAGSMQIFSNGAFVQSTSGTTITNVTASGHLATFFCSNSFTAGQVVTVTGVVFTGTFNPNQAWTVGTASPTQFTVSFLSNVGSFTYVSGGTATIPAILNNPYTLADLPNLRWAQSADTLNIAVATNPLYQLKRLTATTFSFTAPQLLFGPFQDINTDGTTTVYASATQGVVTLTASAPIFKPGHVGSLFYLQEQFLNSVAPWEAQKIIVYLAASSPVGMLIRSDNKIYTCVDAKTSTDHTATGTFQPVHPSGTIADGDGQPVPSFVNVCGVAWQFVSTNAGVALITGYTDSTHVTAVVQSDKGVYSNFPPTVVGGPVTAVGPFTYSGNGSTKTFSGLTAITTADPNQFYVTVGGIFQDPSSYVVNLSGTSITFYTAPVSGASNVVVRQVVGTVNNIYADASQSSLVPLKGLCLSTYWAFGSLSSVQGYASDTCFYNDRLVLSGTTLQPQTIFLSQTSDYLNFNVSDPQVDSDSIVETINSRQQNPINNLLPMNNLLLGTASASWRVTDSSGIGTITPNNVALIPQEFYGMQNVPAIQTGTTIIYAQWGGRKLRDIIYQFYNDKFLGKELTVFARQVFPFGTTITRMAFAPEPYGLIYCVRSDGVMCVCTYLPEAEVTAWTRWTTNGNFEDVTVVPEPVDTDGDGIIDDTSFSVYVIVGRTINGVYQRYIERFLPREYESIEDAFFVDSGLTYNGRNFSSVTFIVTGGTTWLSQDTGTVTASGLGGPFNGFTSSNIGDAIWLTDTDGNVLTRLTITGVPNGLQASVLFATPVPVALQGVTTPSWTFARVIFSGLTNLPGQTVSIFADGAVQPQQVVSSAGGITLPNPGGVVHIGLGYVSQIQSLNMNVQNQPTIRNKQKTIPTLSVVVDQSLPFLAGPTFQNLVPSIQRQFENWGTPPNPYTGILHLQLPTQPTDDAYVCIQQSDPAPLRVLGWVATVDVGESG